MTPTTNWPDSLDISAIWIYSVIMIGLPILGYALMVLDIRAYFRAMRRALVLVGHHFAAIPAWARQETPACLRSLGLSLPCTTGDVKTAYRRRAEQLHPDRGGDRRKFLILQRDFEAAMVFLSQVSDEAAAL